MDIFRTPGAALEGSDKKKFDEVKDLIDSATNDFLVRADWNANMGCVDKINSIHSVAVMNEVLFLLRKKLGSKVPQTVGLTMQLIGSMVNNCGTRFHSAINDEKFMREVGNAIRFFSKRPGAENKDVTDVSLDLVQSWGEAFLPQRRQFYHIVDLYFNLRKEGLPFKTQQFDPSRVPIFTNNAKASTGDDTDAILAAALQSSMALEDESAAYGSHHRGPSHHHRHDEEQYHQRQDEYQDRRSQSSTSEVVESLASCMAILKEMILAATHQMDFKHNEVAEEVLTQLKSFQGKMPALIEKALVNDPDGVVSLFALNEDSQSLCNVYSKIKSCEVPLAEGQRQARHISCGGQQQAAEPARASPSHHTHHEAPHGGHHAHQAHSPHRGGAPTAADDDLLGLGDYSPRHTAPQPVHHHHHRHHEPAQEPHQEGHHQHHHRDHHEGHHYPEPPAAAQYAAQHYEAQPDSSSRGMRVPPPIVPSTGYAQSPAQHGHAHHTPSHGQTPVHAPNRMIPPPQAARTPAHAPSPAHANPQVHSQAHSQAHAHAAPLEPILSDNVITVAAADPFAPDALDALFGDAPAAPVAKPRADSLVSPGESLLLPQPKDPFAPEALDALFGEAPKSAAKADPFSPQALDALFDTPAPPHQHGHQSHSTHSHVHHSSHQTHQTHQTYQQTHQTHQTHVQYDQYGVPVHPGHAPQAHYPPPAAAMHYPGQVPVQAQYVPQHAPQHAPQYGYPHPQHPPQQQPYPHVPHDPHYAPQQASYGAPRAHMVPPPPHHGAQQSPQYGGPSANPFDLM